MIHEWRCRPVRDCTATLVHLSWGEFMSIERLAAEIHGALAALPAAHLTQASTLLGEAQAAYSVVAQGSSSAELAATVSQLGEALQALHEVGQALTRAEQLIERYLASIGAGTAGGAARSSAADAARSPSPVQSRLSDAGRKLVAEVARRGDKISPDKVVRIEKPNRIVWLEEGNDRAGLAHLLTDKRVADFARHGIARDEIVDAVFTALTDGTPIGITGRDRVVYAFEYRGRPVRVAVSVGSNGFIVGANPFSLDQKVKPLP